MLRELDGRLHARLPEPDYAHYLELRPGLAVHWTDGVEPDDAVARFVLPSCMFLSLMLEGGSGLSVGDRALSFGTEGLAEERIAEAVFFSMAAPNVVERHLRRGVHQRHVVIICGEEWLRPAGFEIANAPALHRWPLSQHTFGLAEELLRPSAFAPPLQNLWLEGKAIGLFTDGLRALGDGGGGAFERGVLRPNELRRMRAVKERLEAGASAPPSLGELAKDAGTNVSTLQRQFRAAFGTTVFGYLREHNLQRAREALEQGLGVAEAAYQAGYGSPANFATAFKRRFGISPKRARRRI